MQSSALLLFLLLITFNSSNAQQKVLRLDEFLQIVRTYHPVARQAALLPQQAQAELLIARGGWDPQLNSDYSRKTFNGVNYYSYFENAVNIPLWYGAELTVGYDVAYGSRINSETRLPDDGIGYLGISVPLGSNLFFDQRRAALKSAKLFREASLQQQRNMLNDLMLEALHAYYAFSLAYVEQQIFETAVALATIRFDATRQLALLGDRPAIDTLEALSQLQQRQMHLNDARTQLLQKGYALSNFLWFENDVPVSWDPSIVPERKQPDAEQQLSGLPQLGELEARLQTRHPQLLLFDWKLKQLDVDRKLKIENLKPALRLNYNLLSQRFGFEPGGSAVFANNYRAGLSLSMPLSFAQSRGDLKQLQLKTRQTRLEQNLKSQQLLNQLRSAYADLLNLQKQVGLQRQNTLAYQQLLAGEETRFGVGESSVFLVNAREGRFIEAQQKLAQLETKLLMKEAELKWAAGTAGEL